MNAIGYAILVFCISYVGLAYLVNAEGSKLTKKTAQGAMIFSLLLALATLLIMWR